MEVRLNENNLARAIQRGLDFLQRSQLPSGEFKTFMSTDNELQENCVVDSTPFPTALIAYSVSLSDSATAVEIIKKCAGFLFAEMEGAGLWRYWTKQHHYHSTIPPDLDDIACVSLFLQRQQIPFPSNRQLVLANRNEHGLFYTWLTPRWPLPANFAYCRVVLRPWFHPLKQYYFWKLNESERHDIDCVVNANVLFYLGENEGTGPVVDYLIEVVRANKEDCCDKWHLNRFMFYYAVGRNFQAGVSRLSVIRDEIVERISKATNADGSIGSNCLETALAVCALLDWRSPSPDLARAVEFLLRVQDNSGEWPRAALYFGGPKQFYGWGSEELTTGFCLEALLQYQRARS